MRDCKRRSTLDLFLASLILVLVSWYTSVPSNLDPDFHRQGFDDYDCSGRARSRAHKLHWRTRKFRAAASLLCSSRISPLASRRLLRKRNSKFLSVHPSPSSSEAGAISWKLVQKISSSTPLLGITRPLVRGLCTRRPTAST